jgi:signal transduction histidine kinase
LKINLISSIRWKMFAYFALSLVLAVVSLTVLVFTAALTIRFNIQPFARLVEFIFRVTSQVSYIVPFIILFLVGLVMFFLYFLLLSKGMIRYLEKISGSLAAIAKGDLQHRVPVLTEDELGLLAENINSMTAKLQQSISEERNAERTKYELITSVSHDLRTPLTSIMGYLELIEDDRYRDEVELRYYTQVVYAKAKRLEKLINDLFEYIKYHGTNIKMNFSKINIGELLMQLASEYAPVMEKENMECRTVPAEEKLFVWADGDRIARVFENLLSNAVRYGKEGKYVDLTWRKEGPEIVIEVINYGLPIPGDELPHIFERFYRVEKSRSEHSGCTGLGLAIAKNIVELNEGTISVLSDRNRTLFAVRLKAYEHQEDTKSSLIPRMQ